jgi:hypothetical protein
MRQEHDENDQSKLYHGGRIVGKQAFLQVLDERGFENQMQMGRLEADEGAEQIQGLNPVLLVYKELVEFEEKSLY